MSKQQAIEQFTDRTEPQKAFAQLYKAMAMAPNPQPSRVLTYYGIGGIGKSTLLAKLEDNLENDPELAALNKQKPLVVNFNFETKQEDIQVLTALRNLLSKKPYGWRFPRFEVALYLYGQRIGEDVSSPEDTGYLAQSGLKPVVDVATELPVVGSILKFISIVDQGQAALRSLLKQHSAQVKEMEAMTPEEQREKLPYYFAQDLSAYTLKSSTPLVIMLDTFECVTETSSVNDSLMGRDYWLYNEDGLIPNAENTLFVIAGRRKIPWEDVVFNLEQHLLGSLSPEDSASFLTASGLPQDLLEPLCKLTDGVPVYLDVCVQQYDQLRRKNITPEVQHFGGSHKKLIQRYVRYMDKSEKQLVHMLSFIPEWDEDLVEAACKSIFGHFSPADYNRILSLSITTEAAPGRYFIHRTVAEILQNDQTNGLRSKTAQFMVDHFSQVLETADPYSDTFAEALGTLIHGGMLLHQDRDNLAQFFIDKIGKSMSVLHLYHRTDYLLRYMEQLWTKALEVKDDWFYALILQEKLWRNYQRSGITTELLRDTLQCLKLHIALRGDTSSETLRTLHLAAMFLDLSNQHAAAIPVYEYLIEVYPKHYPDKKVVLLNVRRNLTLCYKALKDGQKETESFEKLVVLYRAELGNEHRDTIRALRDLAICYRNQKRFDEALPLAEEALALSRQVLKEKHPDTQKAINNLAYLHERMGKYDLALPYRKELLELYRNYLGQTSSDTLTAMAALANCYKQTGVYIQEAADTYEELLTLFEQSPEQNKAKYWPHCKTLAQLRQQLQQYDKAAELYRRLLDYYRAQPLSPTYNAFDALRNVLSCYFKGNDQNAFLGLVAQIKDYLHTILPRGKTVADIHMVLCFACELQGDEEGAFQEEILAMEALFDSYDVLSTESMQIMPRLLKGYEVRHMGQEAISLCQRYRSLCQTIYRDDNQYTYECMVYEVKAHCILDPQLDVLQYAQAELQKWFLRYGNNSVPALHKLAYLASAMATHPELQDDAKTLLDQVCQELDVQNIPRNHPIYEILADAYEKAGQFEIALSFYQQFIQNAGSSLPEFTYRFHISTLLRRLNRIQEAEALEKQASQHSKASPQQAQVSYSGFTVEQVAQALQEPYDTAIRRRTPPSPITWNQRRAQYDEQRAKRLKEMTENDQLLPRKSLAELLDSLRKQ